MPREPAHADAGATARQRLAWVVVALLIVGGCVLTLRLSPRLVPALEALR